MDTTLPIYRELLKIFIRSLLAMLVTGLLILWVGGGVFMNAWWFRIAFLLFLAAGALHAMLNSTIRKAEDYEAVVPKMKALAMWLNVLVVVIVFLMVYKPF